MAGIGHGAAYDPIKSIDLTVIPANLRLLIKVLETLPLEVGRMNSPNSPMRKFRLLVENRHGALIKIVGIFSTRAYNINSLYVTPDQDEELSQLTLTLRCDDRQCELLRKQLMKIVDVVDVQVEEDDSSSDNGGYQNGDNILRATR